MPSAPTIHILYENPDWLPPLESALEREGLAFRLHRIEAWSLDPNEEPEAGVYVNRMSPSSHTRGHVESVGLTREVLHWLESWGRPVVNGSRAFEIEMSKLRQDLVLRRHGIRTPRTVLAVGRDKILETARTFDGPFITKHNQGGKGLGIRLMESADQLAGYIDSEEFDPGPNGQIVLQQFVKSPEAFITRVEVVGDRFLFAMRSSTVGGFELCPADACQIPAEAAPVCPADGTAKFSASPLTAVDPLVARYLKLCKAEGIEIAGIEFIEDADGVRYTYDINGTTNYNGAYGREIGVDGMLEFAKYLKGTVIPRVRNGDDQVSRAAV